MATENEPSGCFLTLQQIGKELQCSVRTVRDNLPEKLMVKYFGHVRVRRVAFKEWLETCEYKHELSCK